MSYRDFTRRNVPSLLRLGMLVLLLSLLSAPASAATTEDINIQGRIVNGSTNLPQPVAGVGVSLYAITTDRKNLVGSTQTAGDGSFEFSGVSAAPGQQFAASVTVGGVVYANVVTITSGGVVSDVTVTVYDTTTDATTIAFDRVSMVIAGADPKTRLVTLVESYHITNSGNLTYIGNLQDGQRRSLRFPLFKGARSLVALDGFAAEDATPTIEGFSLASPVRPGQSAISFTYDVPYAGAALTLRRSLPFATALCEVILPGNIGVQSPQLNRHGSVQLAGRNFDTLEETDVAANVPIEVLLSGLPAANSVHSDWDSLPIRFALVVSVLAGVGVAIFILRRQQTVRPATAIRSQRESLLKAVAALDDQAQRNGTTEDRQYKERRGRARERLEELTLQLRVAESGQKATNITLDSRGVTPPSEGTVTESGK